MRPNEIEERLWDSRAIDDPWDLGDLGSRVQPIGHTTTKNKEDGIITRQIKRITPQTMTRRDTIQVLFDAV